MMITRRGLATLLVALCVLNVASAQDSKSVAPPSTSLVITAAASRGRVRFTAPSQVVQMHLEIYSEAGEKLFGTSQAGSVLDYLTMDKAGEPLPDGAYLCMVTVKTVGGKLSQKAGTLLMRESQVSVRLGQAQPTVAQAQAVGPLEENSTLAVVAEGEAQAVTSIAHDGQDGQLARGKGALSFKLGDFYSGTETEQMRLTEEGNLGIGTDRPEARLDVNGIVRAREGFQFADGSILNLAPKGKGLRITLPSGETVPVNLVPDTVSATTQHYIPKFATSAGSLIDSIMYEDPTGKIGVGTTTPPQVFSVRKNGGSAGVHNFGELYVDRDDRTRSASMIVGTAGVLKWIFGMPFNSDGFQVYDLTNNVSRFFVDPTSGNVGIGTNTPTNRLFVLSDGAGVSAIYGESGSGRGVWGKSAGSRGVFGESNSGEGVRGVSASGTGVFGEAHNANVAGVFGTNDAAGSIGVWGESVSGPGVYGKSTSSRGVFGESNSFHGVYGFSHGLNGGGVFGTNDANGPGVIGNSGGGKGVDGRSTSGTGVYGESAAANTATQAGVYGKATGNSGVGVTGESNVASAVGVLGVTSSPNGFALYARNTGGGFGIYSENNVAQNRDKSGFVKAMIYVDDGGNVTRCYNSFLPNGGASTPRCGFDVNHFDSGNYVVDFHFQINDRFLALSARSSLGTNNFIAVNIGANFTFENVNVDTNSKVLITTFIAPHSEQERADARFMLLVY